MSIPFDRWPTPEMTWRKHDFGEGRYETLMVTKFPNKVLSSMFGSERPPHEFEVPDVETARQFLDGEFVRFFPSHECTLLCTVWATSQNDTPPSAPDPKTVVQ
jgi:hypothetical protein